jgi:hypothetical protein
MTSRSFALVVLYGYTVWLLLFQGTWKEVLFHLREPQSTTRTHFDVRRERARQKEGCGRVFKENALYTNIERLRF